ncbi:MAG: Acyl-homoserine lactone acylase QuiP [Chlamydiae bacterium]|nr:Acyl-homoserine lactone acylase QuiP [Chlamydiota bacterium]
MRLGKSWKEFEVGDSLISLRRGRGGVVAIRGDDEYAIQKGLGVAHGIDRLLQMLLTRVFAKGKITEYFFDTEEAFAFDYLARKMDLAGEVEVDLQNVTPEAKKWAGAYCEGVNFVLEKKGAPLLAKLGRVPKDPWTVVDILNLIKMQMYFGLGQVQERVERLIVRAIREGVSLEKLQKLFTPYLDKIPEETIELIRKAHLEFPYLDAQIEFEPGFSNNWVVSGEKSASGTPLVCHDPHLQINRLPSIWYEAMMRVGGHFQMGISMPGIPGLIMGRSESIAANFTYGMMDTVDFFFEEIRDGCCRREELWVPITCRQEVLHRKKRGETILYFYETDTGVLEREDPLNPKIEDGLYLSHAWSGYKRSASPNINGLSALFSCQTVHEARERIQMITIPGNWLLADLKGNIAYQQSGRLPKRTETTLFPLPAWEKKNHWDGYVPGGELGYEINPERGFLSSANDDKNGLGKYIAITTPFASYRNDRIVTLLSEEKKYTLKEMEKIQTDVVSYQAKAFLEQLLPLLPDTKEGEILKKWGGEYSLDSQGAVLFEAFYRNLQKEVFGRMFGQEAWRQIATRHSLLIFIHGHFDRALLSDDPIWYGQEGKEATWKRILLATLDSFSEVPVPTWGGENQFTMHHLFFDGRLPKWVGVDRGPLSATGSRATISAIQIFHEHEREVTTGPSYRFLSDLGTSTALTSLPGGPSENPFSSLYDHDLPLWLAGLYKEIEA